MKKKQYESPRSQGVAFHAEGVVCGSVNKDFSTPDKTSYDSFAPITDVVVASDDWS